MTESGLKVAGLGLKPGAQAAVDNERVIGAVGIDARGSALRDSSGIVGYAAGLRHREIRAELGGCARIDDLLRRGRILIGVLILTPTPAGASAKATACASTKTTPASSESAASPKAGGEGANLQGQVDLGGVRSDLNLAPQRHEAEHRRVDGPHAGSHLVIELKFTGGVGERSENAIPLGRAHGGAGQRLAFRLHGTGLGESDCGHHPKETRCFPSTHVH